ncbi:sulfatase-like hydrolase/transferase [Phaeobacter sp. CAU 1743]|uniref:sulfatase-like hydrolase/transferase n=1 Tax=Phaeobacter sp. CAU 1743 TaxID=3140367 RepID=UPI0023B54024
MTRPNILLISADQQRADCFGFMGRKVKTPHLDQLAADGTHFTACITPSVVCQPARASILTGQLCRTHGVHDNGIDLNPEKGEKGWAGAMAAAGYETSFFGKAHFSTYHTYDPTGTPECLRSSAQYGEEWNGPYMGFQHLELMLVGHNWWAPEKPPAGQHYERFYHADGRGDERTKLMWENAGDTKGAAQVWHSKLPTAYHNTTWTSDRFIEWLGHGRDEEKPFCTWVSFPDPHHPFDCPEPWSRLHDPAKVDLPENRTRNYEGKPWWHKAAMEGEPADKKYAEVRKQYSRIQPQTDEQLREIIANTYGQISYIDHEVGRMLIALQQVGLDENTIVIYISDHGDWLGDHGLILKGPMHYEGLLRVPMIVRGPGVRKGVSVDQPVSTLDLGPTFYDYGEAAPLQTQHGNSLRPLFEDADATREFALNEWGLGPGRVGVALELRTARTRTHKMTIDLNSGAGELYDLVNDPSEQANLFDDPASAETRTLLESYIATRPDDMLPNQEAVGTA